MDEPSKEHEIFLYTINVVPFEPLNCCSRVSHLRQFYFFYFFGLKKIKLFEKITTKSSLWAKREGLKKWALKIKFFEKSTRKSSLWAKREGLKNGLQKIKFFEKSTRKSSLWAKSEGLKKWA